jgi:DNA-binding NarL/FixJ family response regulator
MPQFSTGSRPLRFSSIRTRGPEESERGLGTSSLDRTITTRFVVTGPIKRILIVDDHDALRRGIRALIETRPNFIVVGDAATGHAALEEARRCAPDIAVLDYSLPELNGLDLTIALKREFPRLEVLIYTMHDRDEIITEILKAGARGYVMKSDSEEHLLSALDALAVRRPYFSGAVSEALLEQFLQSTRHNSVGVLTHREREVVQLIAEGKINKQIAGALNISVKTVETHRASAMHKLKLKTTADLVRYAVRNNLIQP